jgi:2-oxoisovalerate dehydrogenase E1 component
MPKSQLVDPNLTRRAGALTFGEIPIHAYARGIEEERQALGETLLVEMLRDMMILREFETMLGSFKSQGAYAGIKYAYLGPAHLSVGQEAAAVGAARALKLVDHAFGSHRGHGEFLAKGLAAIAEADEDALQRTMRNYGGGALLSSLDKRMAAGSVRERAIQFLVYGLLAEIFMRDNGFNRGMGGSMHAFFPPFGIYPNNAIVGASSGIATGAALYKKLTREPGIAVANIGDGSTGCGLVWESMNFAAMTQLYQLWQEDRRGGLPVLFLFNNNFYAMGGQTAGETMSWDRLSRIGAAFNTEALHAETVDGTNPLAVLDAVKRKRALLVEGKGPALLDVECYRFSGHSTTDANAYRTREEIDAWRGVDAIASYSAALQQAGVFSADAHATMAEETGKLTAAITALAVDPEASPPIDVKRNPLAVGGFMFSNAEQALPDEPQGELTQDWQASSRVQQLAKRSRFGIASDGKKLSAMAAITIRDSLFEAILHAFRYDPKLIAYGEENREWGGAFGVYRGLSDILPYHRLFNAPISEAATVSSAVGYALEGGRVVIELMYSDFIGRAGDEIFNQMAKWQAMSGGFFRMPVVLRCSVGSKYGAQHSQDWSALTAHIPGLKVVYPATPYDAKGLMASALAGDDPVVFFESQRLYDTVELFHEGGVPRDYYRVPIGEPDVKRAGTDVTVLTIGPSLYKALEAAEVLNKDYNISCEIIDARSLVPFDYEPVLTSARRTGRVLLVSEANERGSMAMTMATTIQRHAFSSLRAPVRVLGSPNWIVPGADLEAEYFPQAADIVDVVCTDLVTEGKINRETRRVWDDLEFARKGL